MEPEEEAVRIDLKAIAKRIASQLPGSHWGFILLTFALGRQGTMLYIANCNRDDAVQAMREFIAKNAKNPQAFSDQGENTVADQAFEKWWQAELARIKEHKERPTPEELARDAFYAGMIWSI